MLIIFKTDRKNIALLRRDIKTKAKKNLEDGSDIKYGTSNFIDVTYKK